MAIVSAVLFGIPLSFVGAIVLSEPNDDKGQPRSRKDTIKATAMLIAGLTLLGWAFASGA